MERLYANTVFALSIISSLWGVVRALHIKDIQVPSPLATGEGGWLECKWSDDGDNIYALKWYLGLDEFYRWTPAEIPPVKTFPIRGNPITVDLKSSRRGRVKIGQVTLEATGVYRCEVSAEAPSFHTESQVASMTIVDLPNGKPFISGIKQNYQLHDEVNLNCSSPGSQPPVSLAFLVNDVQADPSWLVHYKSQEDPSSGLETTVLGLRFPLRDRLLRPGGIVSVKCTAQILDIYWDSTEAFVMGDLPYHASIMEGRASSSSGFDDAPGRHYIEIMTHKVRHPIKVMMFFGPHHVYMYVMEYKALSTTTVLPFYLALARLTTNLL